VANIRLKPRNSQPNVRFSSRCSPSGGAPSGRRNRALRVGEKVSALNVENTIAAARVTANWR
jgi:hypothetical protein